MCKNAPEGGKDGKDNGAEKGDDFIGERREDCDLAGDFFGVGGLRVKTPRGEVTPQSVVGEKRSPSPGVFIERFLIRSHVGSFGESE